MQRARPNLHVTAIGAAVLIVVLGAVVFGMSGGDPLPASATQSAPPTPAAASATVHVSGAVVRPGLVVVPVSARLADAIAAAGGAAHDAALDGVNLAEPVRDGGHIVIPTVGDATHDRGSADTGIDLNEASASEMTALPGVGPVLAERIVQYRLEVGPFRDVEDLLDVAGIGEAKLATMRPHISRP